MFKETDTLNLFPYFECLKVNVSVLGEEASCSIQNFFSCAGSCFFAFSPLPENFVVYQQTCVCLLQFPNSSHYLHFYFRIFWEIILVGCDVENALCFEFLVQMVSSHKPSSSFDQTYPLEVTRGHQDLYNSLHDTQFHFHHPSSVSYMYSWTER